MTKGLSRAGFDIDLRDGVAREDVLAHVLGKVTIEHKRDYKCQQTGNLFVEYRQHGRPSGISISTAEYWAFEYAETCWLIVPRERLKALVILAHKQGRKARGGDFNEYQGVLLPIEWLTRPWKALQGSKD